MRRTPALVRQWNLIRVLSQHSEGLSIDEMASRTSVNARTIRRDLKVFLAAGIPLRESIGRRNKKNWRVDLVSGPVLQGVSAEEYLALSLTQRVFEPLGHSGYTEALARCRTRAARSVNTSAREHIERLLADVQLPDSVDVVRELGTKVAETFREVKDSQSS